MAVYGNIDNFKSETESWIQYEERLSQYFLANDIENAGKRRAILLSVVGAETYSLLRSIVAPVKPSELSYEEIVSLLTKHYNPKPSPIVQRCKFYACERADGESIASFVARLRRCSEFCEFGEQLEDMLRDRLVVAINDDTIQKRLLSIEFSKLNFQKAFDIAVSMEQATAGTKDIQRSTLSTNSRGEQEVHKVHTSTPPPLKDQNGSGRPHQQMAPSNPCYRCGGHHFQHFCPFKSSECHFCGKKGHIAKVCRSKGAKQKELRPVNQVTEGMACEESYSMFSIGSKPSPYKAQLSLDGHSVTMEVDTGSSVSLISKQYFNKVFGEQELTCNPAKLQTYTGGEIPVLGSLVVEVEYTDQKERLPLLVVDCEGPNIMGRDWLDKIKLDWKEIHYTVDQTHTANSIVNKFQDLWNDELGEVKGTKGKIYIKDNSCPKFFKPRTVPYSMRDKVDAELQRLQSQGVLEPVQFSEWAAPIVPVLKSDGSVRICGDYKSTVNQVSLNDQYPLPRIEDIYATLSGGEKFTKLDMSQAFLQVVLDDDSRVYTTINTQRGLFQYTRLPFGISSSPSIFQRIMDNLIQGLKSTCAYQDDILITGKNDREHLTNLEATLQRLSDAGVRLKREKCTFMAPEVTYLGFKIDSHGLHPMQDKLEAIIKAPAPTNVSELKSYLGLLNYYGRFLPNLSTELAPLHQLLQKNAKFRWNSLQQQAFERSKQLLKESNLLVHFDPSKEVILTCDASPYGLGAIISHVIDGGDRPISCASRTLSPAEKKYSQLEKEALAVVWGVKKFHSYLYGRRFLINNDHKPLETLLGESKSLPTLASGRVQRWALTLSAYDYIFKYKPGPQLCNADALSRLPFGEAPNSVPVPTETVCLMNFLDSTPVTSSLIASHTRTDQVLFKVTQFLTMGWPNEVPDELRPYFQRRDELSLEKGCILLGNRVVVPAALRTLVLDLLHDTHVGIVRMKSFSRSYVFWPSMDKDIEQLVRTCPTCQQSRPSPGSAPLHPWEFPSRPWSRLHIDYAGPVQGKMVLVIIDAHSKWIDAHVTSTSTSQATIEKLMQTFATHGLPDTIVSDNGTAFTSREFQQFIYQNGIKHITVTPYHPSSNGLAERAVGIVKSGLKRNTQGTLPVRLARVLFKYRVTQQTTTDETPAKLLLGRQLKTPLDNLRPNLQSKVEGKQWKQKEQYDKTTVNRTFGPGNLVYALNFGKGEKWLPGVITSSTGPVSFLVQLLNGDVVRKHQDQLRARYTAVPPARDSIPTLVGIPFTQDVSQAEAEASSPQELPVSESPPQFDSLHPPETSTLESPKVSDQQQPHSNHEAQGSPAPSSQPVEGLRRSARVRKSRNILDL